MIKKIKHAFSKGWPCLLSVQAKVMLNTFPVNIIALFLC